MLISWASQQQAFKPAVQLDFTTGVLDSRITFTRTSAATYVNSAGNVVQTPASKNLLLWTEAFDNAYWGKFSVSVAVNTAVGPDGRSTADTMTASGTSLDGLYRNSPTTPAAYTFSVYIKQGNTAASEIGIIDQGTVANRVRLTYATGAVTVVSGTATGSATDVGNGWWRLQITYTFPASGAADTFHIMPGASGGTNGDFCYIWGAQLELGSAATSYVKNDGGLFPARFDYDPATLAPKGLLIESQRTNLLTYSEDWTNAAWSKTNITVTAAATTSPDGTADAQKLEATATAATSIITPSATVAATAATFSVYVKQGTGATTANIFTLRNVTSATNLISGSLNYSTGAFTYTAGSTGVTVTNAGNGWWRVTMTATSGITSGDTIRGYVGFDGGSQTAGDHLFAWGAQLEAGSYATSYIPTAGSQVTRTADVASIVAPNFATWYNQSEGTFVVEADTAKPTTTSATVLAIDASDGGITNRHYLGFNTGLAEGRTAVGGVTQVSLTQAYAANATEKLAYAYKANDFALARNGSLAGTDASGSLPTIDRMFIGNAAGSAAHLDGHIRSIRYFPTRLSNAQLQALSA